MTPSHIYCCDSCGERFRRDDTNTTEIDGTYCPPCGEIAAAVKADLEADEMWTLASRYVENRELTPSDLARFQVLVAKAIPA